MKKEVRKKKRPEYEKLLKIVELIQSLNTGKLEKEFDYGIPKSEWKISRQEYFKFIDNVFCSFYEFLYNYMDSRDPDSKDLDREIVTKIMSLKLLIVRQNRLLVT